LTSSTGGSINLTGSSSLSVPTITSNTNFTGNPTINGNQISVIKIGEIKMFLTNNAPNNFILCNGASYSITQYASLFNLIKYTYGGSGNFFNIPNFQSHFPIGANYQNGLGCGLSNFATGNGSVGASNSYYPSTYFSGNQYIPLPPVIDRVPSHTHNINDPGHQHYTFLDDTVQLGTPFVPPEPEILVYGNAIPQFPTQSSQTGITIQGSGTNIQVNDPVSNLNGVNMSPPYTAVNFYICFE
jgi:microcystin-dependent protein